MRKHNTISKKLKKQFLSINSLIESYFDNIKTYLSYKNKLTLLKNKLKNSRVFLTIATLVILSLTILLMPTFYNKMIIESKIKDQIFKNYGISLSFKNKLIYGLFPKPHFIANDLIILNDKKEIANIEKLNSDFLNDNHTNVTRPKKKHAPPHTLKKTGYLHLNH